MDVTRLEKKIERGLKSASIIPETAVYIEELDIWKGKTFQKKEVRFTMDFFRNPMVVLEGKKEK